MPRANVAYEDLKEARKKLRSIKPLKWHRASYGLKAEGTRGAYALVQRSPDRRHGAFPWVVRQGGVKGPEIKPGGFDTASEAKDFARLYDAGLCGAPPQVVVTTPGAPYSLPAGTYRGTLAERRAREGAPYSAYTKVVEVELRKMGSPSPEEDVTKAADYIARMEEAGVGAEVTAAVVSATMHHAHMHVCPEKTVEMNEAGEARRGPGDYDGKYKGFFVTVQKPQPGTFIHPQRDDRWMFFFYSNTERGGSSNPVFTSKVSAIEAAKGWIDSVRRDPKIQRPMMDPNYKPDFMPPSEETAAEEAKKRLPQPDPSTGYFITHSSLTRDLWLMHEDRLVARSTDRGELLKKAEQLSSGASEGRRPKG